MSDKQRGQLAVFASIISEVSAKNVFTKPFDSKVAYDQRAGGTVPSIYTFDTSVSRIMSVLK